MTEVHGDAARTSVGGQSQREEEGWSERTRARRVRERSGWLVGPVGPGGHDSRERHVTSPACRGTCAGPTGGSVSEDAGGRQGRSVPARPRCRVGPAVIPPGPEELIDGSSGVWVGYQAVLAAGLVGTLGAHAESVRVDQKVKHPSSMTVCSFTGLRYSIGSDW